MAQQKPLPAARRMWWQCWHCRSRGAVGGGSVQLIFSSAVLVVVLVCWSVMCPAAMPRSRMLRVIRP